VYQTRQNSDGKAGALNQALGTATTDIVMVLGAEAGYLQGYEANEYERYGVQIGTTGRVTALTATAALVRTAALAESVTARGEKLPGEYGDAYDAAVITDASIGNLTRNPGDDRLVSCSKWITKHPAVLAGTDRNFCSRAHHHAA
jgi:hypothetical protein